MPQKTQSYAIENRRLRNKSTRTLAKSAISKAEETIETGDLEQAQAAVTRAVSTLDKASGKGILHANNAARRKSRLLKKLNQAKAAGPASTPAK